MQKRHRDRKQYFLEQGLVTKKYVIPYIENVTSITNHTRVLEVGCGEGGNLAPFIEKKCNVVGVDINKEQIARAKSFINEQFPHSQTEFFDIDIYKLDTDKIGTFDLIMLRDVIEHIPNQDKFLKHLKSFLKPEGVVFFGFPPWCMPFGGHQQICKNKFLSVLPYYHLLPYKLYRSVLQLFGEKKATIDSLMEIKDTGISINRFEKIIVQNGYRFIKRNLFLINPNYEIKFGLKPKKQFKIISKTPILRDFLTTCHYSVVKIINRD